ncbi:unnamed protein product [Amoebophrya sp. A120]|nr:unnamed protein product [Amoebophrya sp. A120]|eukprot:GSA120T00025673001.1
MECFVGRNETSTAGVCGRQADLSGSTGGVLAASTEDHDNRVVAWAPPVLNTTVTSSSRGRPDEDAVLAPNKIVFEQFSSAQTSTDVEVFEGTTEQVDEDRQEGMPKSSSAARAPGLKNMTSPNLLRIRNFYERRQERAPSGVLNKQARNKGASASDDTAGRADLMPGCGDACTSAMGTTATCMYEDSAIVNKPAGTASEKEEQGHQESSSRKDGEQTQTPAVPPGSGHVMSSVVPQFFSLNADPLEHDRSFQTACVFGDDCTLLDFDRHCTLMLTMMTEGALLRVQGWLSFNVVHQLEPATLFSTSRPAARKASEQGAAAPANESSSAASSTLKDESTRTSPNSFPLLPNLLSPTVLIDAVGPYPVTMKFRPLTRLFVAQAEHEGERHIDRRTSMTIAPSWGLHAGVHEAVSESGFVCSSSKLFFCGKRGKTNRDHLSSSRNKKKSSEMNSTRTDFLDYDSEMRQAFRAAPRGRGWRFYDLKLVMQDVVAELRHTVERFLILRETSGEGDPNKLQKNPAGRSSGGPQARLEELRDELPAPAATEDIFLAKRRATGWAKELVDGVREEFRERVLKTRRADAFDVSPGVDFVDEDQFLPAENSRRGGVVDEKGNQQVEQDRIKRQILLLRYELIGANAVLAYDPREDRLFLAAHDKRPLEWTVRGSGLWLREVGEER